MDVDKADLRAEGVALGSRRRTILASIALYAPIAYADAVVLRDSPHAFGLRVAIALISLFVLWRLSKPIDELPQAARSSARLALIFGMVAAVLAAGLGAGVETTQAS